VTLRKQQRVLAVRGPHPAPGPTLPGGVLPTHHHGSKEHRVPGDGLRSWSGMADTQALGQPLRRLPQYSGEQE
jgi:hypothetical protein